LSDRIGPRLALAAYALVWSLATIATGLTSSLLGLVAARFTVGVGESPVYPTAARMIASWIPDDRRGSAQGAMHAVGRIGNAAAPIAVTALIVAFSWRASFIILGVITLAYVAVLYGFIRDDPRQHPRITAAELERLGHGGQSSGGVAGAKEKLDWADFIGRVWPATAVAFCHGWMLWFFLNWVPTYFARAQGLALTKSAVFSTIVLIGGVIGTFAGGMLTDWWFRHTGSRRRGRRDTIIFGFIASGIALSPMLFTNNLGICAASLGLAFCLSEIGDAPLWMVAAEVEPRHAATSAAATFTGMAIAGAVSPIIVGELLDLTGSWVSTFAVSIFMLLLGPLFATRIRLSGQDVPENSLLPVASPA
jgi:MFS family permease